MALIRGNHIRIIIPVQDVFTPIAFSYSKNGEFEIEGMLNGSNKNLPEEYRMARQARAALADMRAIEEEKERMNPINPKKAIVGAGATPSMGLSQFRGGKSKKAPAPPSKPAEDSDDDCECAGKMLAEHIHEMHGGAYMEKFLRGMGKAMLGKDGHGMKGGINTGAYEGEGKNVIQHVGAGNVEGPGYEAVVGGKKAKAKRAPATPSDARRKRGALVSQLMKSKGMTLGEASKHIREHPELLK